MGACPACDFEAEHGTPEVPHPVDPRAHECQIQARMVNPEEVLRGQRHGRTKAGDETAARRLAELATYYGQPVMPVEDFCARVDAFVKAVREQAEDPDASHEVKAKAKAFEGYELDVGKSNLLFRLLYLGEKVRTRPCPVHKGQWSGCVWQENYCQCMSGANVTGWLPEDDSGNDQG